MPSMLESPCIIRAMRAALWYRGVLSRGLCCSLRAVVPVKRVTRPGQGYGPTGVWRRPADGRMCSAG